jgi:hypothetical protein
MDEPAPNAMLCTNATKIIKTSKTGGPSYELKYVSSNEYDSPIIGKVRIEKNAVTNSTINGKKKISLGCLVCSILLPTIFESVTGSGINNKDEARRDKAITG